MCVRFKCVGVCREAEKGLTVQISDGRWYLLLGSPPKQLIDPLQGKEQQSRSFYFCFFTLLSVIWHGGDCKPITVSFSWNLNYLVHQVHYVDFGRHSSAWYRGFMGNICISFEFQKSSDKISQEHLEKLILEIHFSKQAQLITRAQVWTG